jgi:hypothetical protein
MARFALILSVAAIWSGCTGREILPVLAVHGFARLIAHDSEPDRRRAVDYGATLQLVFGHSRTRVPKALALADAWEPSLHDDIALCPVIALCDWAVGAETAALAALGAWP